MQTTLKNGQFLRQSLQTRMLMLIRRVPEKKMEHSMWKWQPTPVFLPGESQGGRSLVAYSPRGHKESALSIIAQEWQQPNVHQLINGWIKCISIQWNIIHKKESTTGEWHQQDNGLESYRPTSPNKDIELTTVYGPENLRENSRDQLRSYGTQTTVKSRRNSNKRDRKIHIWCTCSRPFLYAAWCRGNSSSSFRMETKEWTTLSLGLPWWLRW